MIPEPTDKSGIRKAIVIAAHADEVVRDQIARILGQDERWNVLVVRNGGEAVRVALAALPQLMVIDLHLPGMDGAATLAALRAHGITCPMLALDTADHDEVDEWKARGFADCVTISKDMSGLMAHVSRLLG
jgi:DNA-binding response OmpR family regulator